MNLYGDWLKAKPTYDKRMNEVLGFSVDSYNSLQSIYSQINSAQLRNSLFGGVTDIFAEESKRLIAQFNGVYSGAIQKRDADAAAHAQRLAELEQQRQAAEAAAARHRAWQSNMPLQNRQDENLPDTIAAGTADSADGGSDVGGDVGGKPRRRRGSLSSNLGINA